MKAFAQAKNNALFSLLILFGFFFAWFINNDQLMSASNTHGQYLVQALDISQGKFAIRYERGPIFPLLLAGAIYIGNDLLVSAFWVTQFIFLVSLLLTVYLTNILYGKRVALISAAFLYSSRFIFDLNWVFGLRFLIVSFLLASCILFVSACKSPRKSIFYLSGVALGLAILSKETGFFYIYFPFLLLLIPNFRKKEILYGIGYFYVGFLFVALLWGGVLLSADQSLFKFLGFMSPRRNSIEGFLGYSSMWPFVTDLILKGPFATFRYISASLMLFPLSVLCSGLILWKAIVKKSESDRILILLMVPMSPLLAAYGLWPDGIRHIVLILLFSHILLARGVGIFWESMASSHNWREKCVPVFIAGVIIFSGFLATIKLGGNWPSSIVAEVNDRAYRFKRKLNLTIESRSPFYIAAGGRFGPKIYAVSKWINENLPAGSKLCVGGLYDHAIYIYTKKNYIYDSSRCNVPRYYQLPALASSNMATKNENIVAITTTKKIRSSKVAYRKQIYAITERTLHDFVEQIQTQEKYILKYTGSKIIFPVANEALDKLSQKIYSKDGVSLYKTNLNRRNTSFLDVSEVHWSPGAKEDLYWLRDNYPKEFQNYIKILKARGINFQVTPDSTSLGK